MAELEELKESDQESICDYSIVLQTQITVTWLFGQIECVLKSMLVDTILA